ncbi:Protein AIM2 [Grifola frondosa]|uniref:Protein AIM2 n=1 Tax=Grifola frondosa TaxID=5627 RepID=A0A1C7M7C0_GRIFR|nr:Protein AIM2 [Grifola frondosa]
MACAECVSGSVHTGTPTGTEITLASLSTYAVGDESSKRIIVMGADIFGWKFINTRLLADEYAARGFRVLVPDFFDGAHLCYELPEWTLSANDPANETATLFQRFIARPISLFILAPFVLRHTQPNQTAKLTAVAAHLREAYPDAKIGYVGFCWGGRYALTLNALFDATFAAHPSLVKYPAELVAIEKPISFAIAATDYFYDAAQGKDTEKRLKEKGLTDVEVIIYEGVPHGWTMRANLADPKKKEARDKAVEQVINWFDKYLTTIPASDS